MERQAEIDISKIPRRLDQLERNIGCIGWTLLVVMLLLVLENYYLSVIVEVLRRAK